VEIQGWLAEGGGCVGVAAVMHEVVPKDGKATAIIISGGNVDVDNLRKILV
jgi:threonine dehydratase